MPQIPKPTLKTYFETGDVPSQSNFEDLIDSCYNERFNWVYQQFSPEQYEQDMWGNPTFKSIWVGLDGITLFDTNGNSILKETLIKIPGDAKRLKKIRLFGQGYGVISRLKVFYFTDFVISNPALNPTPNYPGTRYTYLDINPNLSLTTSLFDKMETINLDLPFQTYRYLVVQLRVQTPNFIFGEISLKPIGLEYE